MDDTATFRECHSQSVIQLKPINQERSHLLYVILAKFLSKKKHLNLVSLLSTKIQNTYHQIQLPKSRFNPTLQYPQVIGICRYYVNLETVFITFKEWVWLKQTTPTCFIQIYFLYLLNMNKVIDINNKIGLST